MKLKRIVIGHLVAALLLSTAGASQAGIITGAIRAAMKHKKMAATGLAVVAAGAGAKAAMGGPAAPASSPATPTPPAAQIASKEPSAAAAGGVPNAQGVIGSAEKTQAAANGVVAGRLTRAKGCAALVKEGVIKPGGLAEYKCVLTGPVVARASAEAKLSAAK